MKKMLYLMSIVFVFLLVGCSGDFDESGYAGSESGSPKYDVFYCKGTSTTATANGYLAQSAIYGTHKESLTDFTEILSISGEKKLMDSCAADKAGNLYWTDRSANGIFRSDSEGKHVEQIVSGLDIPFGLAIDEANKRIYWSNWIQSSDHKSGEIGYSDLDGGNKKIIIRGLASGGSLTVARDKLFISDLFGGKIIKSDLEGAHLEKVVDASQPGQTAFDYQNNKLIWTDIADDKISSTDLSTLQTTDLIVFNDARTNPQALAIEKKSNKILFIKPVENGGLGPNPSWQLHSADLDGNNIKIYRNLPVSLHAVKAIVTAD